MKFLILTISVCFCLLGNLHFATSQDGDISASFSIGTQLGMNGKGNDSKSAEETSESSGSLDSEQQNHSKPPANEISQETLEISGSSESESDEQSTKNSNALIAQLKATVNSVRLKILLFLTSVSTQFESVFGDGQLSLDKISILYQDVSTFLSEKISAPPAEILNGVKAGIGDIIELLALKYQWEYSMIGSIGTKVNETRTKLSTCFNDNKQDVFKAIVMKVTGCFNSSVTGNLGNVGSTFGGVKSIFTVVVSTLTQMQTCGSFGEMFGIVRGTISSESLNLYTTVIDVAKIGFSATTLVPGITTCAATGVAGQTPKQLATIVWGYGTCVRQQ